MSQYEQHITLIFIFIPGYSDMLSPSFDWPEANFDWPEAKFDWPEASPSLPQELDNDSPREGAASILFI